MTSKELIVLKAVINCEFQDDIEKDGIVGNGVWTFALYDAHDKGVKGKTLSGVIASLVKKGYVWVDEEKNEPDSNVIAITEEGWNVVYNQKVKER